jgi:GT2 family glycosyltransferase
VPTPRVLFAITVYNGRDIVPQCLRSAAAMDATAIEVDLICLDDASPEPGFSEETAALCAALGIQYYRTPRNLGIPRNFNMALLRGREDQYDYVVIANSDVLFAKSLLDELVSTAEAAKPFGTMTAWSNNVSVFSLPNESADKLLSDQRAVSWVGETLSREFGQESLEIPAGVGFLLLFPLEAIRAVGLMDPIFGRGYCEELDWTIRASSQGLPNLLAPSAFAYHQGGGTNSVEGLVAAGHTTVPENEAIIDMRYPDFRQTVTDFMAGGSLAELIDRACKAIMLSAAEARGYEVVLGGSHEPDFDDGPVVGLEARRDGGLAVVARYLGFRAAFEDVAPSAEGIIETFGGKPRVTRLYEPAGAQHAVGMAFKALGVRLDESACYPSRV